MFKYLCAACLCWAFFFQAPAWAEEAELEHTYTDDCPACRQKGLKDYANTKVEEFKKDYPELYAFAKQDNVRRFIQMSMDKAQKHELFADREINGIRIMMTFLGCDFDQDPMYPWVRLQTFPPKTYKEENPPSWVFVQEVYARFYAFHQKTTGKDFKYLRNAGMRLLQLNFQDIAQLRSDTDILNLMAYIYPERYAEIPEQALLGPVMQAAAAKAQAHGLDQRAGKALFAGLIFYFGISVDTDPLYANLFAGLEGEAPHLAKDQALFARLQNMVRKDMGL